MDTWEEVDNEYFTSLKNIQEESSKKLTELFTKHFNYIIKKYGRWSKYPRKVKKTLKKERWWELRNSEILENDSAIKIIFKKLLII